MIDLATMVVSAVVSGLIGGAAAGVAALATVRVQLQWLRRDVDDLREAMGLERRRAEAPR